MSADCLKSVFTAKKKKKSVSHSKNCRKPTQPPLCCPNCNHSCTKRIHWGSSLREPTPHNGNKTNIVFLVISSYAAKQTVSRPSSFSVPVGALLVPFGVVYVWALGAALPQLISCNTNSPKANAQIFRMNTSKHKATHG